MQFQRPSCPKCRALASHILETLLCHVPIEFRGKEADYTGEFSEMLWDTSEIARSDCGKVTLHCNHCGHSWDTRLTA